MPIGHWTRQRSPPFANLPSNHGAGFGVVYQPQNVQKPSEFNNKKRHQSTLSDTESEEMDIDPSGRRLVAVGAKWKKSTTPIIREDTPKVVASQHKFDSDAREDVQADATPTPKKFKFTTNYRVDPSPGRTLAPMEANSYRLYDNEKVLRLIHSKWPRPRKKDGFSRVTFPGSKEMKNKQYCLVFYNKDHKYGWHNPNELPMLVTAEALAKLGLNDDDFYSPPLASGWWVSLLFGPDRKPVIPNARDKARDPTSDGTGISHMVQRALLQTPLDTHALTELSIAGFLTSNFANCGRDQIHLVYTEILRNRISLRSTAQSFRKDSPLATTSGVRPFSFSSTMVSTFEKQHPTFESPLPSTLQQFLPASNTENGAMDDSLGGILQALPQVLTPIMEQMKKLQESSQKGYQDNLMLQQNNLAKQFQLALTSQQKSNAANLESMQTIFQNTNKDTVEQLVSKLVTQRGEIVSQRTSSEATATQFFEELAAQRTSSEATAARLVGELTAQRVSNEGTIARFADEISAQRASRDASTLHEHEEACRS